MKRNWARSSSVKSAISNPALVIFENTTPEPALSFFAGYPRTVWNFPHSNLHDRGLSTAPDTYRYSFAERPRNNLIEGAVVTHFLPSMPTTISPAFRPASATGPFSATLAMIRF
jgi:hypothetical protein